MQLKGQLDAYSQHRYATSYPLEHAAYVHMGMRRDTHAAAIVKKFPAKFEERRARVGGRPPCRPLALGAQ